MLGDDFEIRLMKIIVIRCEKKIIQITVSILLFDTSELNFEINSMTAFDDTFKKSFDFFDF